MTRAEAILKLGLIRAKLDSENGEDKWYDPEPAHGDADEVLCELLRALGYGDVVEAYDKIMPKWYA